MWFNLHMETATPTLTFDLYTRLLPHVMQPSHNVVTIELCLIHQHPFKVKGRVLLLELVKIGQSLHYKSAKYTHHLA